MQALPPPRCEPVDLAAMLAARERRAERQRTALARFGLPIASVTLVMPGPVKDTPSARFAMQTAEEAMNTLFLRRGWKVAYTERTGEATGAEALYAVTADAIDLKRSLVALEDTHPLGRLWDLDVLCPVRGGIARGGLGLAARRCLLCNEPAHACARSRRHPLPSLLAAIEGRVHAYRGLVAS